MFADQSTLLTVYTPVPSTLNKERIGIVDLTISKSPVAYELSVVTPKTTRYELQAAAEKQPLKNQKKSERKSLCAGGPTEDWT
jgi:hypothetical protein